MFGRAVVGQSTVGALRLWNAKAAPNAMGTNDPGAGTPPVPSTWRAVSSE